LLSYNVTMTDDREQHLTGCREDDVNTENNTIDLLTQYFVTHKIIKIGGFLKMSISLKAGLLFEIHMLHLLLVRSYW